MPKKRPPKPYPEFPLNAHKSGQWVKTIRGKKHYFGVWADPDGALDKYLRQKDDLYAGRVPQEEQGGCTVAEVANEKLHHLRKMIERGERQERTYGRNRQTAKLLVKSLGRDTLVESLRPTDFERLRADLGRTVKGAERAPSSIATEMTNVVSFFKHALRMELIDRLPSYGASFDKPSSKVLRKARKEKGEKYFSLDDVQLILNACNSALRPVVLFAMNTGVGDAEICTRTKGHIKGEWFADDRVKTLGSRRVWLWPETMAALDDYHRERTEQPQYRDMLFLNTHGRAWNASRRVCPVTSAFTRVLKRIGIYQKQHSLGVFRSMFQTIADELEMPIATRMSMGHTDSSMAGVYRQRVSDERLREVSEHVRRWYFPLKTITQHHSGGRRGVTATGPASADEIEQNSSPVAIRRMHSPTSS